MMISQNSDSTDVVDSISNNKKKSSRFEKMRDSKVWNTYKKGDDSALIFIYSKYVESLFNFGCHYTSNHELVKDCIQDMFVMLKNKQGFGKVSSIKPYLFKVLRREIVRALSKESRFSLKASAEDFQKFEIVLSWDMKMIEEQLTEDRKIALQRAIGQLTEKQREAIIYYFYEGFSYEEVSQIMDMSSVKSARKLVYRAIDSLKNALGEDETTIFLMLLL